MMVAESAAFASPGVVNQFFLARQPILNREQRLFAYELLYRNANYTPGGAFPDGTSATASVIAHANELGMQQVVGDQLAFVNVDAAGLMSDFIGFLPHDKVILEVLETVDPTDEVIGRIHELKGMGYRFALDDVATDCEVVQKLQPLVDIIKVDIKAIPPEGLAALTDSLRSSQHKLLAEKVETQEEFQQCLDLGYEYFQGYYFAKPAVLTGKKISPSQIAIIKLLELLTGDAEQRDIEQHVKQDPLISVNLLKLVNTPGLGSSVRINSVGHALMVLGRRQLQRWLQILLYARGSEFDSPLLQLATSRGKMMELMMERLRPRDRVTAEIGFTVGIMSLMDALFSIQMDELLESINVPEEVRDALLHREGEFGEALTLIELVEMAQGGSELGERLDKLGMDLQDLYETQLTAYEWVNGVSSGH
jgi:EAL and modified HD-GYP domain-containing signal transduction protein